MTQAQQINRTLSGIIVCIFAFLAHRIYIIESNHLSHIEADLAVSRTKMENIEARIVNLENKVDDIGDGIYRMEAILDTIKIK